MAPRGVAEHPLVHAVVQSPSLARSPALRKLLLYLGENRQDSISEYAIAVDVFSRPPTFDPRTDATVRVQISRLRQKLKEHYESDGAHESQRLVIPPGTHLLEIETVDLPPAPALSRSYRRLVLYILAAALAAACTWFAYSNHQLRRQLEARESALRLPPVWQTLLRPARLTRILYPIPVFYQWDRLRVRDVGINDPAAWPQSPHLRPLIEKFGPPSVSQSYSVSSDTLAVIQLTRFLSERKVPLEVSPTASLSLDQYGNDNLVFLGIPPTSATLDQHTRSMNFVLAPGGGTVTNRQPLSGEPTRFDPTPGADPRGGSRYGIVALIPGPTPDSSLLLLVGLHTASLATFLTSPPSLGQFATDWETAGRPSYFEAVVRAEIAAEKVRAAQTVAFRPIRASR